ncbi:MAG TPA: ATP-binding protein [Candidatus Marinimicrobia bacterium]|nr:ATP-binding protein [Candidatus Neomarinimicrobiota bacterium]
MYSRSILDVLTKWKNKSDRKPLVLRGARQVGKTTAVQLFSQQFDNYIYLNLDLKKDRDIFNESLSIQELFQAILVLKNITLKKGSTLIFIDEIQNSPIAVKMLRYFFEEMKELFVIAAGSLFEIMLERTNISFPVGRVEFFYMYPLTFEEFLNAKNENKLLEIYRTVPLKPFAHSKLLSLFHQYTLIGGMPEIIQKYINNEDITALATTYESLLASYIGDSEKYADTSSMRNILRHCIESIPFESGQRIKFQGFGNSNYRSREVAEALRLIERAMLIYLIYPSTTTQIPIQADLKKSPKLQFIDTGLLNYFVGLQPNFFRYENLHSFYKGIIAEHIVRQELIAQNMYDNKKVLFWVRQQKQSTAEVDMVLQYQNYVIPIEVKAGKAGTLRSLHQFVNHSNHSYAVRLYAGNLEITNSVTPQGKPYKLLNLPYFLAGKIFNYIEMLLHT